MLMMIVIMQMYMVLSLSVFVRIRDRKEGSITVKNIFKAFSGYGNVKK